MRRDEDETVRGYGPDVRGSLKASCRTTVHMNRPFRPHINELNSSQRFVPGPVVALVALGAVPMVVRLLMWHSVLDLVALIGTVVAMWALLMRPWKEGPANVDFLAEAMSLMAAGFVVIDSRGRMTKVNRTFCELFGVDVDVDVKPGTSAFPLFLATGAIGSGSVHPEQDLQELQLILRSADFIRGANIERCDGKSFAMTSVPLRVNSHRLGMAVFWDDTQWNREQHEVSEARHDAERGRSAALSMVRLARGCSADIMAQVNSWVFHSSRHSSSLPSGRIDSPTSSSPDRICGS